MRTVMRVFALCAFGIALGVFLYPYANRAPRAVPVPVYRPVQPAVPHESREAYEARFAMAHDDVQAIAILIYTEARGESELGQRYVAWVALGRFRDQRSDFGRASVTDVVFKQLVAFKKVVREKKVFRKKIFVSQFAGPVHYGDQVNFQSYAYRKAFYIALDVYAARWEPPPEYRDVRYFYNAATSDKDGAAWQKKLVPVLKIGKHIFSRERYPDEVPPKRERAMLTAMN